MKLRIIFSVALCFISVLCFSQILMQDNFDNNILSSNWTREGTGVNIDNGIMKLTQDVTDRPTNLFSKWITFNATKPIIISRRVNVKNAGDYFYANMTLHFNNNTKGNSISIQYLYTKYYDNAYKSLKQGTQINYNSSTFNEKIIGSNIFGDWFTEKIIYYPTNGNVYYYRNDELIGNVKTDITHKGNNTIRLSFSPYGWYTNHYHYFDDILITQNGKIPQNNSQNIVSNSKANVPKSNVIRNNQLSKEAKDVYKLFLNNKGTSKSHYVKYNGYDYLIEPCKDENIDLIILTKYINDKAATICIFTRKEQTSIVDFGRYSDFGGVFKLYNEKKYYAKVITTKPRENWGLFDLNKKSEIIKPEYEHVFANDFTKISNDIDELDGNGVIILKTRTACPNSIYNKINYYNLYNNSLTYGECPTNSASNTTINSSSNNSSSCQNNQLPEYKLYEWGDESFGASSAMITFWAPHNYTGRIYYTPNGNFYFPSNNTGSKYSTKENAIKAFYYMAKCGEVSNEGKLR